MFVLFTARRNPAKVPAAMLTRSTLDAVGKAFSTGKRVPDSKPDAAVLRDLMLDSGIETLAGRPKIESRSILHRWSVLDAIQSAESVPQLQKAKTVLALTRAWVDDPSLVKGQAASDAADLVYDRRYGGQHTAADRKAAAACYPAWSAAGGPSAHYYSVYLSSLSRRAKNSAAIRWADAADLRIRVLATLAEAGVLPEPPKLNTRS